MNIAIRTDASLTRGSGHVMRCLCLADALFECGHAVTVASIEMPEYLREMSLKRGHKVVSLPDQGQGHLVSEAPWSDEAQARDAAAVHIEADLVIVDHYGLGLPWEKAQRQRGARLVVIDDLARPHDCDMLLDQNFYRTPARRYAGKLASATRELVGPRFALIRPEFAAQRRQPRIGPVSRILVFVGGMDAGDATSLVLKALDAPLPGHPAIDVVIGGSHPRREAIESLCLARGWTCHVQTSRMAELLAAADLVIGSGGTNTWERMTVGVPTLALCIAENQRALLDECAAAGLLYVADESALSDPVVLRTHILALMGNSRLRQQMALAGMELVDGQGAARVARAVSMLEPIVVRRATLADSAMLFAWRNHESIRAVSRNSDLIATSAHDVWFAKVLADSSRSLLVGERSGLPIGCVRFDENGPDSVEISIYLAPDAIGTGAGNSLLAASEAWLAANRPHIARIDAEVLGGNAASSHLFERAGYRPDAMHYSKGLHI